jgi:hypothetical protein
MELGSEPPKGDEREFHYHRPLWPIQPEMDRTAPWNQGKRSVVYTEALRLGAALHRNGGVAKPHNRIR